MSTTTPAETATIEPRALRRALGNFATGVTVITATADGRKVGVTANSFNSVSLDPPLVLWSIAKQSSSFEVFEAATHFAINILSADQIDLSNRFARPSEDKFAGVDCATGPGNCLLLPDTSANFQCEKHQIIDGGDHWILIGKVVAFEDHGRSPLLYHQGTYCMVLPHPHLAQKDAAAHQQASDFQERLKDNLYYLMTQAVRNYQQAYQPQQLESGWRPSEARILMILDAERHMDLTSLVLEASIPRIEVEQTLDDLHHQGLVAKTEQGFGLTAAGVEQAERVWDRAHGQQEKVFGKFSQAQIHAFKQVLREVIAYPNTAA